MIFISLKWEPDRIGHQTFDVVVLRHHNMMTSSNGNIFRVTFTLWVEFIGDWRIPLTKASDPELWCFLWSAPEKKRLSKQSRRRWFETPSCSLWHHCNGHHNFLGEAKHQESSYVMSVVILLFFSTNTTLTPQNTTLTRQSSVYNIMDHTQVHLFFKNVTTPQMANLQIYILSHLSPVTYMRRWNRFIVASPVPSHCLNQYC